MFTKSCDSLRPARPAFSIHARRGALTRLDQELNESFGTKGHLKYSDRATTSTSSASPSVEPKPREATATKSLSLASPTASGGTEANSPAERATIGWMPLPRKCSTAQRSASQFRWPWLA